MTIRWPRLAVFVAATLLSLPGAVFGLEWLWVPAFALPRELSRVGFSECPRMLLLAANLVAWLAYVVSAAAWIVDRRVSRAWPIAGMVSASTFALQFADLPRAHDIDIAAPLAFGVGLLLLGLLMVLPATLLPIRLVVFHLRRPTSPPAAPRSP